MRDQYLWTVAAKPSMPVGTPVRATSAERGLMFAVMAVFTALTSEKDGSDCGERILNLL